MLKTIVKWLMPANKSIADATAANIKRSVNAQGESRREALAKYATLGKEIAAEAEEIAAMAEDGKIDDEEEKRLSAKLEPLIAKSRAFIGI